MGRAPRDTRRGGSWGVSHEREAGKNSFMSSLTVGKNPARFLEMEESPGEVAPGRRATDLLPSSLRCVRDTG